MKQPLGEIIYAVRKTDGQHISILDVPIENVGLKCECVCHECGKMLEACSLQGKVSRYFRHHADERSGGKNKSVGCCNVAHVNETALHKMAKEIINRERKISVPAIEISLDDVDLDLPRHIKNKLPKCYIAKEASILICDDVLLEERIINFRPDATVIANDNKYFIEIFATHETKKEKIDKVDKYGCCPMLEINLNSFLEKPISEKELQTLIVSESRLRKWIYLPNKESLIEDARNYYESMSVVIKYRKKRSEENRDNEKKILIRKHSDALHKLDKKIKKEEKAILQRQSEELKLFKENAQRERNCLEQEQRKEIEDLERKELEEYERLKKPEIYAGLLRENKNKGLTKEIVNKFKFFKNSDSTNDTKKNLPFFVNIPISGETVFACDRRLWESAIFDKFIYNRKKKDNITIENISKWLKEYQKDISFNWNILIYERWLDNVLITYFDYLDKLGFVETVGPETYMLIKAGVSLPPNKEYARRLFDALHNIDKESPCVDELIKAEIVKEVLSD